MFLRARFKALIKQLTNSNTGQYTKKSTHVTHRASLKIMAKKNSVNITSKTINIIKIKNTKRRLIERTKVLKNEQRTYKYHFNCSRTMNSD